MATLGDALAALTRQIKTEKLEPLLGMSAAPAARAGTALTGEPVTPVAAATSSNNLETEQLATPAHGKTVQGQTAPAAGQPGAAVAASAYTRLSADASLIMQLLADAPDAPAAQTLAMDAIDASNAPPEQVAKALARSLATSGVFYESHLQEWVAGERPLDALRAEPHNRLPINIVRHATASSNAAAPDADVATATNNAANSATGGTHHAPLPEALALVVREQLDILDLRRVQWQGEVWPQQQAQLEIAEDETRREYEQPGARTWRTTLRLDLPHLGEIEVHIALDASGIGVRVQARDDAVDALKPGRAAFATALQDAGVALRAVEVAAHG